MPITITAAILNDPSTGIADSPLESKDSFHDIVVPGEVVFISGSNLITGHGTYRPPIDPVGLSAPRTESLLPQDFGAKPIVETSSTLPMYASLAGHLKSVNKLMYVEPPNARYAGNVGDTVVGRITEVEQRRWKVDVNSYQLANLSLANVKLPTGELRRKSEDDERAMRSFMREGDLIVAEVREVFRDGSLQLHMPGKRTGRLGEGCLVHVPPSLIRRQKIHRHNLAVPRGTGASASDHQLMPGTVSVGLILGCNGNVWVGPSRGMELGLQLGATISAASRAQQPDELLMERMAVSRVRNVIASLATEGVSIWETSVLAGCEASWLDEYHNHGGETEMEEGEGESRRLTRLLRPEHRKHLASLVLTKINTS
ncbi:Exosome complex component RRP4 [Sparganum proliferum]